MIVLFRHKLFGSQIEPDCSYCKFGSPMKKSSRIVCAKGGIVSPGFHCRRFSYDPLKRVPQRPRRLPRFDRSDFEL